MIKQRRLINVSHPFWQLLILFITTIICLAFLQAIGLFMIGPLFHVNYQDYTNTISNSVDDLKNYPSYLASTKFIQGISELAFLAPPLFFALLTGIHNDYLKFNRTTYLIPVILAIMLFVLVQPLINYLGVINENMQLPHFLRGLMHWMRQAEDSDDKITSIFLLMPDVKELLLNLLIMAIIPAICEEAFFRGGVQQILGSWVRNKHVVVWVTAAIFSAVHFEFFGFLPRFLMGGLLGYLFLWGGSLWYSVMAHMTNNGLAIVVTYLYQHKTISYNPDSNDIGPFWIIIVSTLFVIGVIILYRNYFKHHPPEEDNDEENVEVQI